MSRSSKIELLYFCVLIESLAGYAYDEKHNGRHTDGKHDDLYPHGTKHAKHDKDATFAYQIVETDRTFTYDAAGKLVSATETEDNYGTYIYTYEYDLMGNRTYMEKTLNGTVAEWHKYEYNESNQLVSEQLYNGKKTTSLAYTYDADGNRITETGKVGTDKVEKTYEYTVENRLAAVHDGDELLLAAAYDGDGNRVFLLNYNLHTDDDWKGNSGNGNGNNKDNSGSGNNGKGNSGNNGNGNGNGPPELVESPSGICEAPTIRPVRLSLPYLRTTVYRLWQPPPHLLQPCLLPARPLPQTERNVNHANTNLTLGNPPTGYPIGCECDCIGCFGIFFALDSVLFDSFFRIRPVFLGNPPFCKQQPAPILTHFPGAIAFVPDSLPCPLPLITLAKS